MHAVREEVRRRNSQGVTMETAGPAATLLSPPDVLFPPRRPHHQPPPWFITPARAHETPSFRPISLQLRDSWAAGPGDSPWLSVPGASLPTPAFLSPVWLDVEQTARQSWLSTSNSVHFGPARVPSLSLPPPPRHHSAGLSLSPTSSTAQQPNAKTCGGRGVS
ncbi:hypothetical protein P4O66_002455 [Electrophorus voltai]|uniref:Uncharacterized protein n=1 Tax=Electrophorus voltai TaxID=2609070 RepID=A0AAD8YZE2_9TELE|nr:hypothetical protein P4O66_002455 [Electrophorus voltai]